MSIVIIRSVSVGVAAIVVAGVASMFIGVVVAMAIALLKPSAQGAPDVGWDLLTIAHSVPTIRFVLPLAVIVVGFLIGFRYFSMEAARRANSR